MSGPDTLDPVVLESINIINALRRGTVPAEGLSRIVVGLDQEEKAISGQLDIVATGGSDLKFVRGEYGSGKTFLVARALELAREKGFVTSHISVSPICPLHRLRLVYGQIIQSLRTSTEEHAFKSILDLWIYGIEERVIAREGHLPEEELEKKTLLEIEQALSEISLLNVPIALMVRTYYHAQNSADFRTAQAAIGWLSGDPNIGRDVKQKAGIKGMIEDSTIVSFLQALPVFILGAGYAGCAVAIDELEITQTFQKNLRERGYHNLVRIIDAIDGGILSHWYLLGTGTPMLFEGQRGMRSVPPLFDRVGEIDHNREFSNPRQSQIALQPFNARKLEMVAQKVIEVYAIAYGAVDRDRVSHRFIRVMVHQVCDLFGGRVDIIPRIFLKKLVDILDKCDLYPDYDPLGQYQVTPDEVGEILTEEEIAVMKVSF